MSKPYECDYRRFFKEEKETPPWRYDLANEDESLTFEDCLKSHDNDLLRAVQLWSEEGGHHYEDSKLSVSVLEGLLRHTKNDITCWHRDTMNSFQDTALQDGLDQDVEDAKRYFTLAHTLGNVTVIPEFIRWEEEKIPKRTQQSKGAFKDKFGRKDSEFSFLRSIQGGSGFESQKRIIEDIYFSDYIELACLETYCAEDCEVESFNKFADKCEDPRQVISKYEEAFQSNKSEYIVIEDPENWYLAAALRIEARGRFLSALLSNQTL